MDSNRMTLPVPSISISDNYLASPRYAPPYSLLTSPLTPVSPFNSRDMQNVPAIHIEAAPQPFHGSDPCYGDMELLLNNNDITKSAYDFSSGLSSTYDSHFSSFPELMPLLDMSALTGPDLTLNTLRPESPASSYYGSQSPASIYSDLSDNEYSPHSPRTPDEGIPFYPRGLIRPSSAQHLGHRHTSSESIHPSELLAPTPSHHRSNSMSSLPRARVATTAMLDANARRRVHPAQFQCGECGQQFTAQFSLKRHQQSHTGERLYECSIPGCGQRFFNSSDCKRHEKSKKRHSNL